MKRIVLDAPATAVRRIQIAKIGQFKDGRYGEFAITPEEVTAWGRNLALLPGGRALIDEDHSAERPQPLRDTAAQGWITGVDMSDGKPMATVEWTPAGEKSILDKRYLFISPTYGPWTDEQGATHDDVLSGAGLTNRPFLNMPAISLASESTVARALEQDPIQHVQALAASGQLGDALAAAQSVLRAPDSPAQMKITPKIRKQLNVADTIGDEVVTAMLKALGVDDKADETQIVKHLDSSLVKPEPADPTKPADTKTLEQLATEAGKTVLDSATYNSLVTGAAAGLAAKKELHQAKFDAGWTAAVDGLRRLETERPTWEHFYELDAEGTLKVLADSPPLFNARPIGSSDTTDPEKMDPRDPNRELAKYDKAARKMMLDKRAPESAYPDYLKAALEGRTI